MKLITTWQSEDDNEVNLLYNIPEGRAVMLTTIWWFQDVGINYRKVSEKHSRLRSGDFISRR
jgi:hypothetical protein